MNRRAKRPQRKGIIFDLLDRELLIQILRKHGEDRGGVPKKECDEVVAFVLALKAEIVEA
jgi:hypothetical protein